MQSRRAVVLPCVCLRCGAGQPEGARPSAGVGGLLARSAVISASKSAIDSNER